MPQNQWKQQVQYQGDDTLSRASHQHSHTQGGQFGMLNTQKFLKTDLNEYLKSDQERCISCSECMKSQEKNLFYKYPAHMKTNY
jgi:hypothetical protein